MLNVTISSEMRCARYAVERRGAIHQHRCRQPWVQYWHTTHAAQRSIREPICVTTDISRAGIWTKRIACEIRRVTAHDWFATSSRSEFQFPWEKNVRIDCSLMHTMIGTNVGNPVSVAQRTLLELPVIASEFNTAKRFV